MMCELFYCMCQGAGLWGGSVKICRYIKDSTQSTILNWWSLFLCSYDLVLFCLWIPFATRKVNFNRQKTAEWNILHKCTLINLCHHRKHKLFYILLKGKVPRQNVNIKCIAYTSLHQHLRIWDGRVVGACTILAMLIALIL